MNISGNNSALYAALAGFNNLHSSMNRGSAATPGSPAQAAQDLTDQVKAARAQGDMVAENNDLSQIWLRARDWGLEEQTGMAMHARDVAMRSANEATVTDAQREIMNQEIQGMQAETTRIAQANNINGNQTLMRKEIVETVVETTREIEVEGEVPSEVRPQIDVLWVVDRSGSMGGHISHIGQDASKMFQALEDKGFNVRMAIESFEYDLDTGGSADFQSDVAVFESDVSRVLGGIAGGIERGLRSIDQAMTRYGGKFDPDATKVTILLTDEFSDDFFYLKEEIYGKTQEKVEGEAAEKIRQKTADSVKGADSELYVVARKDGSYVYDPVQFNWTYKPADSIGDKDYSDVVDKVGKGTTIELDYQGNWVDEVTKNFIASVETNISKTVYKTTVTDRTVTRDTVVKDDWDLNFQVGAEADKNLVERFKTSTAETSGLAAADVTTVQKAQESLDTIDVSIQFFTDNRSQVGSLGRRLNHVQNEQANLALTPQQDLMAKTNAFNRNHSTSLWSMLSAHLK